MASPRLKPISDQVLVITGATSGIGLATARMAAERGASVMLVARNEDALRTLRDELRGRGTRAEYAVADVGDLKALEEASRRTVEAFGGFDSWVNNAGVSTYGVVEETPLEDQKRLFDTVYWGVVNGSLVASRHLKQTGGVIVNVGSVLSDRAMMLQGTYSAAKHAVKGITDVFRMEFEQGGHPVLVTLIKPSSTDTLFPDHARNLTDAPSPTLPPPVYHPRVVGRAILHACEYAPRTLVVGMGGYAIALLGNHFPRLTDYVMEQVGYASQTTRTPRRADRADNLYEPRADLAETSGVIAGAPRRTSLLLEAQMNPLGTAGVVVGVAALGLGLAYGLRQNRNAYDRLVGRETRKQARSTALQAKQAAVALADEARSRGHGLFRSRPARRAMTRAEQARHSAWELLQEARSRGHDLGDAARGLAEDAASRGRGWLRRGHRDAEDMLDRGRHAAEDLAARGRHYAEDAADEGWSLFRRGRKQARKALHRGRGQVEEVADHGWSLFRRGRKDAEAAVQRGRGYAEDVADRGWSLFGRGRRAAEDLADRGRDYMDDAAEHGQGLFRRGRKDAEELLDRGWHRAEDALDHGRSLARQGRREVASRGSWLANAAWTFLDDLRDQGSWLFGRAGRKQAASRIDEVRDSARSLLEEARERGESLFGRGREEATTRAGQVRDAAASLLHEAEDRAAGLFSRRTRKQARRTAEEARQLAQDLVDEIRGRSGSLLRDARVVAKDARREARRWI
ncbi:SDR family oxidoreductase [Roseomonas cutis]|uniref:SDR family oxidoreductase n=1 Tax=Roseomonas cutis TaxID=2897332 RepID=UPI00272D7885|nr:SDR family oxidoreductase [Roseomonas sp. OT10]